MNASLWQLAGWTMIHSLWLGAAVALAGGFLRLASRHAAPNTRYAISLAALALLALTPLAAAAWLSVNGVPQLAATSPSPRYSGERLGEGQNDQGTWPSRNAGATNENPFLAPALPGTDLSDLQSTTSEIIDLTHSNPSLQDAGEWGEGFRPLPATPHVNATVENPSPNPSLPGRGIASPPPSAFLLPPSAFASFIPHLPTLWLIGAPLTFTLLATGLLGSARLRRRATPLTAGSAYDACERLRQTLKITRRVALAACDGVAQPILVGVLRPLILLPTAALAGWTPEQLDMVLLHELAHVRRWDNLVNLLQRIVESLLFFHPAVWLLSRQVRRDREECCDAAVIRHTDRPHQYAELLVSIAAALRGGPAPSLAVASAMASHPLAGRIRRILNLEEEPMRITRRTLAATLLLPLLLAGVMLYGAANAEDGNDPPPSQEQPSTVASGERAQGGSPEETPATPNSAPSASPSDANKPVPENSEDSYTANYPIQPNTRIDLFDLVRSLGGHNLKLDMVAGEWVISLHAPKQAHNRLRVLLGDPTLPQPAKPVAQSAQLSWNNTPAAAAAPPLLDSNAAAGQQEIIVHFPPSFPNSDLERERIRKALAADSHQATLTSLKSMSESATGEIEEKSVPCLRVNVPDGWHAKPVWETSDGRMTCRIVNDPSTARLSPPDSGPRYSAGAPGSSNRAGAAIKSNPYAGGPGSPNQGGAAAGSHANDAQPTTNASPNSAAPAQEPTPPAKRASGMTQEDLKQVLTDTRHRLNNQIDDLKRLTAERNGTESEAEIALRRKILEWQVVNDARRKADGSGSPNQGAAATETDGDKPQPIPLVREFELRILKEKIALAELNFFHELSRTSDFSPESVRKSAETAANTHPDVETLKMWIKQLNVEIKDKAATDANTQPAELKVLERRSDELSQALASSRDSIIKNIYHAYEQLPKENISAAIADKNLQRSQALVRLAAYQRDLALAIERDDESAPIPSSPSSSVAQYGFTSPQPYGTPANNNAAGDQPVQLPWNPPAGGPDSPPQGGAATGSASDKARPTANASPGSAAPVQEPEPASPFPILDNQKIADRAYKLLGLELEPLTPEELERVKKLGYNGGLRIVSTNPGLIRPKDLLVGLHAWPVTDLQSLDAILTRDDLGELAPLKFYVVRDTQFDPHRDPQPAVDRVVTGRVQLQPGVLASQEQEKSDRTGSPDSPNEGGAATGSNDNARTTANAPQSSAKPVSDVDAISVMQPPTSQKTSIFGGTVTTAYLKVKFGRLSGAFSGPPGAFTSADVRLTPQEIAIQAQNCIDIVKSPSVLKAALAAFTPRETVDMKPADAVEWLRNRLSATFPGDGEIFELRLDGGDAKEDSALLQAIIDAFMVAMKAMPESPADPNAATDAATVPPSDLSAYGGRNVNIASTTSDYQHPDAFLRASLRSRESGKPVVVHLLAHNSEPSRRFVDEVLADAEVSDFIAQNFESVTIYADDEPAFAKAFHINLVPANMFVFAGGDRTTGGIAPPATPAHYLAHLKTYHKLATTPAIQNGDAPLVPGIPLAAVADRSGAENKSIENDKPAASVLQPGDAVALKVVGAFPEAPLDGVFIIEPEGTLPLGPLYGRVAIANKPLLEAEAAVKEYLGKTLTDVAVQLTLAPNQPTAESSPPPAAVSLPTFLYDGKTFEEWRDLWKLELNPERRTEAINAMAAFSQAGYGDEAADAILNVAGEYTEDYVVNSPEARLRDAIEAAVIRMPAEQWLPPLMKLMAEDNAKWRRLASQLLYRHYERSLTKGREAQTSPETIALLKLMARDPKYGPNALPLDTLIRLLPKGDMELDQLISEALAGEDTQNAVHVVGNLSYSRLDQFPEQFEFLFHNDPEIRRYARRALPQASAKDAMAVADRLTAVLNDPQRSADHAEAVRAMGELIRSIAKGGSSRLGSSVNAEDFEKKFRQPVERLLNEGPPELLTPSLVALGYKADDSSLIEQRLGDGLSAERKSLIQETLKKLTAEEKEVLPRQLGF